jgi:5'-deoxynucleotidase YfbR-like HD superfamily hydrolase
MSQTPDAFGLINNTIKTFTGQYFDLARPNPDDIDIESIAHALSNICRFGGHCPQFYSVAEHCLHCAKLAYRDKQPIRTVMAILLHDAAEAYLGDIVKPLKVMLPKYQELESQVELAIERRFGVDFDINAEAIKNYDRALLKAEKVYMWPDDAEKWAGFETIPKVSVRFNFFSPREAEITFKESWSQLNIELNDLRIQA